MRMHHIGTVQRHASAVYIMLIYPTMTSSWLQGLPAMAIKAYNRECQLSLVDTYYQ